MDLKSLNKQLLNFYSLNTRTFSHSKFQSAADATTNKYLTYTNCDLWEVGEEFSRKPYAFAVQEGSPLQNELSNTYVFMDATV